MPSRLSANPVWRISSGQFKKQLAERMLAAELTHQLNTEAKQGKAGNHRNGASPKTVITPNGELNLDIPRDRQATFEPQLVAKYQRHLPGFDDNVISMDARGMSVREITGHLQELYGLDVSPDLISTITDEMLTEVEHGSSGRWKRCIRSCISMSCG